MNNNMNNKKIGTDFEREVCEKLRRAGWWVHFISPDYRGAQPFDIITVGDGTAIAIDCKTSVKPIFPIDRLESNQKLSFEKWLACGNEEPLVMVKFEDTVRVVPYLMLKKDGKVDLRECICWDEDEDNESDMVQ